MKAVYVKLTLIDARFTNIEYSYLKNRKPAHKILYQYRTTITTVPSTTYLFHIQVTVIETKLVP